MMNKATRVSAPLPCAILLLAGSVLQASAVIAERVEIPFDFQVQKHKIMPAGDYRVEQDPGSGFALLVNRKTGETVELPSPPTAHQRGKVRLVFEKTANGHWLKSIS
jgi:hypothetical protein